MEIEFIESEYRDSSNIYWFDVDGFEMGVSAELLDSDGCPQHDSYILDKLLKRLIKENIQQKLEDTKMKICDSCQNETKEFTTLELDMDIGKYVKEGCKVNNSQGFF